MSKKEIAPCGLDCLNCELYEKNNNTQILEQISKATGKSTAEIQCKGCRLQPGCIMHADCKTLECVNNRGLSYCYECDDFPCALLSPALDQAERLPHNLKVYNLCCIKNRGEEAFLEESALIRKKYFKGKMILGIGPQLET